MNVFKDFLKKSSWLFILEIFLKIKGFLLIPLITKNLGVINYGEWSQINILITTIFPLVILGTDSAIIRFLAGKDQDEQKRKFTSWLVFLLGMSLFGSVVLYLLAEPLAWVFFNTVSEAFLSLIILAIFTIIINVLFNAVKIWFRIINQTVQYAVFLMLQGVFNLLAVVAALLFVGNVYNIILFTLISDTVLLTIYIIFIVDYHLIKIDLDFYKELFKYGWVLVPSAYAMWILNSSDRLFLAQYTDLTDIGIYSLAYSVGYLVIQLFVNPVWTMFPNKASELFNKGQIEGLEKLWCLSKRLIVIPVYASAVFFSFSGKTIINIISKDEFSSGYIIIPIISLAYLFHMLSSYDLVLLGLVKKQKYDAISMFFACIVHLLLNFLLIPIYGIIGAAISTYIGYMVQFIVSHIAICYYIKYKMDWSFHLKMILFSFMVYAFLWELNNVMVVSALVSLFVNLIFVFILYLGWIFKFRRQIY